MLGGCTKWPNCPSSLSLCVSLIHTLPQQRLERQLWCTALTAAVIGALSWEIIEDVYWLTFGFWYSSLALSILGISLSASEATVLYLFGAVSVSESDQYTSAT